MVAPNKPSIIHTATPAGQGTASSHASRVNGQWLSTQAQEAVSKMRVHRAFDEARDPLLAKQLKDADLGKTEKQRRDEQQGEPSHRQQKRLKEHVRHVLLLGTVCNCDRGTLVQPLIPKQNGISTKQCKN